MALRRLALTLAGDRVAIAERLLTLAGAVAIAYRDAGDAPLIEPAPGTEPLWPRVRIQALFPLEVDTRGIERILAADADTARWDRVEDHDWQVALEQRPEPLPIGARLMLAPVDWSGPSRERMLVRLHLGLAFGTGAHPTTALCLEWLERADLAGTSVVDLGCGSGILAVTALKLGAERAWATDIEPQALLATRHNALENEVADRLWLGAPDDLPAVRCDVVLANIVAGTLIESAGWIAAHLVPHGHVVLSGILARHAGEVERAFAVQGFGSFERKTRDEWLRITAELG